MKEPVRAYRDTARGIRRRLITTIQVTRDLNDIGVRAGSTGQIDTIKNGHRYIITFDDPETADAVLQRDEFEIVKQSLDTSKEGVISS